jgi:hypothetical protein
MARRTLVLVVIAVVLVMMRPAGQTTPARAGRVIVPAHATVEPLAQPTRGGNAVLRVRFEEGYKLPVHFRYATEVGTVVLADDGRGFDQRAGDGLFTALGTMDLAAVRARLVRLSTSRTAMPLRAWRHRSRSAVDDRVSPQLWQPGQQVPWVAWGEPGNISQAQSLLIRDLGVVEDPSRTSTACGQPSMGAWSFGYLMEQMANTPVTGVTGSEFAAAWLDRWASAQVVNGWTVNPRTLVQSQIIDPWLAASGGNGASLDLAKAPFRLLAIVNRLDLRSQAAYGGTSGGELRFVFTHAGADCDDDGSVFNVIFEFGIPAASCLNLKALAGQWKALDALALGSPQYNAALEAITEQVVAANAGGSKPNGSALNQLRTNENRLDDTGDGLDWQMREFRIDATTHLLGQTTTTQTPDSLTEFGSTFADYVNEHAPAINLDDYVVPLRYPTLANPFRAGASFLSFGTFWDGTVAHPIVDRDARHKASLNTCNGCHSRETDTAFTHVGKAPFGTEAPLSGFLTGIWVDDPADGSPTRYFDDLTRRAVDLDALLNEPCFVAPLDLPLMALSH